MTRKTDSDGGSDDGRRPGSGRLGQTTRKDRDDDGAFGVVEAKRESENGSNRVEPF